MMMTTLRLHQRKSRARAVEPSPHAQRPYTFTSIRDSTRSKMGCTTWCAILSASCIALQTPIIIKSEGARRKARQHRVCVCVCVCVCV